MESSGEKRSFQGCVTKLYGNYGMVDEQVYFDYSCVTGKRPTVGSKVTVSAVRESASSGWRAVEVSLVDSLYETFDRTSSSEAEQERSVVGKVTKTSSYGAVINDAYQFDRSVTPDGYVPFRGDWLRAEIRGYGDDWTVTKAVPIGERQLRGRVTSLRHGNGMIDEDVFFQFSACVRGYRPRMGDVVEAYVIEFTGFRASWRATFVQLGSKSSRSTGKVRYALLINQKRLTSFILFHESDSSFDFFLFRHTVV